MPKLNQNSLDKMFPCQYCEELFRTRQGLSGHIQWKHASGKAQPQLDYENLKKKADNYVIYGKHIFLTDAQIQTYQNILKQWAEVALFCKYLNFTTNNTDFKNYIITSLAQMRRNEELEERLKKGIRSLFDEYTSKS